MTLDDIEHRMAAQIHPEEARSRSDFAIENDGTLEANANANAVA
jgi:dephospho-CoA kinase